MAKSTFQAKQEEFGPYYFGHDGGGSAASTPTQGGFASAPSLSPGGKADTSFANMAQNAIMGAPLSQANPGLLSGNFSLQGLGNSLASGIGRGLMSSVPGLNTMSMISSFLGNLSQFATNRGLLGGDPSGLHGLTQQSIQNAMNVNAHNAAQAAQIAIQNSGHLPGTLGQQIAQNQAALLSGPKFSGPDPEGEGSAPGTGVTGGDPSGNSPGISGVDASNAEHEGGYIEGQPGQELPKTLLAGEYVIKAKATKLRRNLLDAINRGAGKSELVRLMKAGK